MESRRRQAKGTDWEESELGMMAGELNSR